jgi:Pyridoxamine 5'-phosphate oxidase
MEWAALEQAAPDIAAAGRERMQRFGFVLVGTIQRDGTPRISPVEAHVVGGRLMLAMMPRTLKARDLLRDPRLVLNTPIDDPHDPGAEFKLRGRAVVVGDRDEREATADAIKAASGWRPRDHWHLFAVDVEEAAHIVWENGAMRMTRWSRDGGIERAERPPPDVG